MGNRKRDVDQYQYTKLADIKDPGVKVNIYGIVKKIIKQCGKTASGKYHSIYDIVDDSVSHDQPFRVHIFVEASDIASHIEVGSILRIHRLQVEEFNGCVDGRIQFGKDLAVFSKNDSLEPDYFTVAKSLTFTDYDTKRLAELREIEQVTCIFQEALNELSNNEVPSIQEKESETLNQQKNDSSESLLEETEDQRLAFKTQRTSSKRKGSPVNSSDFESKIAKGSPAKSLRLNGVTINLACGENRLLNPVLLRPEKKCMINPFSAGTKAVKAVSRNDLRKETASFDKNASIENEVDCGTLTDTGGTVVNPDNVNAAPQALLKERSEVRRTPTVSEEEELEEIGNEVREESNGVDVFNVVEKPIDSCSSEVHSAIFMSLPHVMARTKLTGLPGALHLDNLNNGRSSPEQHAKKAAIDVKSRHSPWNQTDMQTYPQEIVSPSSGGVIRTSNDQPSTSPSSKWLSSDKNQTYVGRRRRNKTKEAVVQVVSLMKKDANSSPNKGVLLHTQGSGPQGVTVNDSDNDVAHDLMCRNTEPISSAHQDAENGGEDDLCSANFLAQTIRANNSSWNVQNANKKAAHSNSADAGACSTSAQDCPGLACIGKDCDWPGPVLLEESDPRIATLKEEELITDSIGDIPEVDENGTIILRSSGYMPYGDGHEANQDVSISFLNNFKWPQFRAKIKIIKIKPSFKVLETSGPKNFVCGRCVYCGYFYPYSQLEWNKDHANGTKKPMCPLCSKDGHRRYVTLEFRLKLIGRDTWGTELAFYAVRKHAARFLGCSLKEYQENEDCRKRVMKRLSGAISSQLYFSVCLSRVSFTYRPRFFVFDTTLPEVLS